MHCPEIIALGNADKVTVGGFVDGFLDVLHRSFLSPFAPCAASFQVYIIDVAVKIGSGFLGSGFLGSGFLFFGNLFFRCLFFIGDFHYLA